MASWRGLIFARSQEEVEGWQSRRAPVRWQSALAPELFAARGRAGMLSSSSIRFLRLFTRRWAVEIVLDRLREYISRNAIFVHPFPDRESIKWFAPKRSWLRLFGMTSAVRYGAILT